MAYHKCASIYGTANSAASVQTASGPIANFNTKLAMPLKSLEIDVNATQEAGTPTPSEPKAISGVSAVNVFHCGKNLIDISTLALRDVTGNNVLRVSYAPIKCNAGKYTLSFSGSYVMYITNITAGYTQTEVSSSPRTITLTNDSLLLIRYSSNNLSEVNTNIQFENSASATTYEPYNGNTYNILFPPYSENLPYFEGLLNGTYDFVDLGSITYTRSTYQGVNYFTASVPNIKPGVMLQVSNVLCSSRFTVVPTQGVNAQQFVTGTTFVWTSGLMYFRDDNYSDATAFKNSLNGVYLIYELAEPKTPTITPEQYETLLKAFAGVYYGGHFTQDKAGHRQFIANMSSVDLGIFTYIGYIYGGVQGWYSNGIASQIAIPKANGKVKCSIYKQPQNDQVFNSDGIDFEVYIPTNNLLKIKNSVYSDATAFKNAMQGIYLFYELAEPFTIDLPDGQPIKTLPGINNIYADTGDTKVSYKKLA